MKSSLSVFFPVFNNQATLATQIADLLEVLPDLTPNFELVVIDDGSSDATCEVVHELSAPFPQVHSVVHPARWGQAAAMRTGLLHSSGEFVLMRSEGCQLSPSCLPKMWQAFDGHDVVLAALGGPSSRRGVRQGSQPSWSLIRRELLDSWRREADDEDWLGYVQSRARVCELEFPPRAPATGWHSRSIEHAGKTAPKGQRFAAASAKRPNYLGRLKSFALGE